MIDSEILETGLAVAYTSGDHGDNDYNPLWGGEYGEVVGIITGFTGDGENMIIKVSFPTLKSNNVYTKNDLTLIEELEESEEISRQIKGLFNI